MENKPINKLIDKSNNQEFDNPDNNELNENKTVLSYQIVFNISSDIFDYSNINYKLLLFEDVYHSEIISTQKLEDTQEYTEDKLTNSSDNQIKICGEIITYNYSQKLLNQLNNYFLELLPLYYNLELKEDYLKLNNSSNQEDNNVTNQTKDNIKINYNLDNSKNLSTTIVKKVSNNPNNKSASQSNDKANNKSNNQIKNKPKKSLDNKKEIAKKLLTDTIYYPYLNMSFTQLKEVLPFINNYPEKVFVANRLRYLHIRNNLEQISKTAKIDKKELDNIMKEKMKDDLVYVKKDTLTQFFIPDLNKTLFTKKYDFKKFNIDLQDNTLDNLENINSNNKKLLELVEKLRVIHTSIAEKHPETYYFISNFTMRRNVAINGKNYNLPKIHTDYRNKDFDEILDAFTDDSYEFNNQKVIINNYHKYLITDKENFSPQEQVDIQNSYIKVINKTALKECLGFFIIQDLDEEIYKSQEYNQIIKDYEYKFNNYFYKFFNEDQINLGNEILDDNNNLLDSELQKELKLIFAEIINTDFKNKELERIEENDVHYFKSMYQSNIDKALYKHQKPYFNKIINARADLKFYDNYYQTLNLVNQSLPSNDDNSQSFKTHYYKTDIIKSSKVNFYKSRNFYGVNKGSSIINYQFQEFIDKNNLKPHLNNQLIKLIKIDENDVDKLIETDKFKEIFGHYLATTINDSPQINFKYFLNEIQDIRNQIKSEVEYNLGLEGNNINIQDINIYDKIDDNRILDIADKFDLLVSYERALIQELSFNLYNDSDFIETFFKNTDNINKDYIIKQLEINIDNDLDEEKVLSVKPEKNAYLKIKPRYHDKVMEIFNSKKAVKSTYYYQKPTYESSHSLHYPQSYKITNNRTNKDINNEEINDTNPKALNQRINYIPYGDKDIRNKEVVLDNYTYFKNELEELADKYNCKLKEIDITKIKNIDANHNQDYDIYRNIHRYILRHFIDIDKDNPAYSDLRYEAEKLQAHFSIKRSEFTNIVSEQGKIYFQNMEPSEVEEFLTENNLAKKLEKVPENFENNYLAHYIDEYLEDTRLELYPDIGIFHGMTGVDTENEALNRFENILKSGGLKSISKRRKLNTDVKSLSPIGDMVSGIDDAVPCKVGNRTGFGSYIFFLAKRDFFYHPDIFLSDQDFGAGNDRYQDYNRYADSIEINDIHTTPSIESRNLHLDKIYKGKEVHSGNEYLIRDELTFEDMDTIIIKDFDEYTNEIIKMINQAKKDKLLPKNLNIEFINSESQFTELVKRRMYKAAGIADLL